MAQAIFGNHAAVRVPRTERDRIRRFYRDVLGCTITRDGEQKDDIRMGDNFYIAFLYENEGVALDESGCLKAIYLQLKTDNVDEMPLASDMGPVACQKHGTGLREVVGRVVEVTLRGGCRQLVAS